MRLCLYINSVIIKQHCVILPNILLDLSDVCRSFQPCLSILDIPLYFMSPTFFPFLVCLYFISLQVGDELFYFPLGHSQYEEVYPDIAPHMKKRGHYLQPGKTQKFF